MVSEDPSDVTSILLFTTFSLVASAVVALVDSVERSVVKTPSALVALVTSLFKLVLMVASPLVRSVISVARFVVKTPSALVALVTSAFSAVELPVAAAST